jgi:hypothetical protein
MAKAPDRWHRWLLDVQFGGDPAAREQDLSELLYPVHDRVLADKVGALYDSIQPPLTDPMGDFDERDLLREAEQAGFPVIDLELRLTVERTRRPVPWERFLRMSGNPLVPPMGEALDRALSPAELTEFAAHLKPLVESGTGEDRRAFAFLTAVKE